MDGDPQPVEVVDADRKAFGCCKVCRRVSSNSRRASCDVGHPLPQGLEGSQAEVCLVHLPSLERNGPPNMASDKSIELEPGVSQGVVTYVRHACAGCMRYHMCA